MSGLTAHRAAELGRSRCEGGGGLRLWLAPQHERHTRLHDARLGARDLYEAAAERSLFNPNVILYLANEEGEGYCTHWGGSFSCMQ